jgi:hypothetical protein
LLPFVDRLLTDETVSPLNKKCHNVGLKRLHLDVMEVGTSLHFVFLVGCLCITLCCDDVGLWCFAAKYF